MANIKDIQQGHLYLIDGSDYIAVKTVADNHINAYYAKQFGDFNIYTDTISKWKLKKIKPLKFRVGDEIAMNALGENVEMKVKSIKDGTLTVDVSTRPSNGGSAQNDTKNISAAQLSAILLQLGSYRRTNPRLRKIGLAVGIGTLVIIAGVVWYKSK